MKLPIFGILIRKVAVAKFTRTLGTMISSGVPILDGLDIVAKTAGNKTVENAIYRVKQSISEGKTIAEPLEKSGVFPSMVCQMITVGEQSGSIDTMLNKIADFYDDEVDDAVGNLTAMMEPLLMLFLGAPPSAAWSLPCTCRSSSWPAPSAGDGFSSARTARGADPPPAVLVSSCPGIRSLPCFSAGRSSICCAAAKREHPSLSPLYLLVGVSYLQALLSAGLLPKVRRLRLFAQAQVVWDLLFVAILIYCTGGIDSIFSFLFLLVIVSSSVFLRRKEVLFVASAAAILYGSLLDLQFYGYLPHLRSLIFPERIEGRQVFYAVFVNVLAFFLTGFLSGTVSERLRRSEQALERRETDFEELEHLNRSILANITSGLMIVDSQGRIRSFNSAAGKITGFSLRGSLRLATSGSSSPIFGCSMKGDSRWSAAARRRSSIAPGGS